MLQVDDVWFAYGPRIAALRGVGLTVAPGERVALIGRNGSGKTTLARHLNGLLRPDRGRVLVDGLDTREHDVGELARLIGYVFQNPDHQLFNPSVREELAYGPRTLGLAEADLADRVEETLRTFDLAPFADSPPSLLGFAQRRLVAIAAVVAARPATLVLDEPYAGLSWPVVRRLGALLDGLAAAGHAVLTITHQMRAVAEHAERCVVLEAGQVLADRPVHDVLTDPDLLARSALAPTPSWQIGDRLRRFGFGGRSIRVDELVQEYARLRGLGGSATQGTWPGSTDDGPTTAGEQTE